MLIKASHTLRKRRQIQELEEHHQYPRGVHWYLIIFLIYETSGHLSSTLYPRFVHQDSPSEYQLLIVEDLIGSELS